ncbi:nucleotide disphospho-sugar-binding domain-containing protein [Bradyrhizobium sp. Ai1a-2]|uniref:nucleotide disphospho-sugar-binding domain-containing protein n=1 Tax=Bradyrhizobium sp. Ai1a-2 TaxID=196490 RepID=UPI000412EBD9|nr:nucleotide disphospho-sugar-binding domain-containing protein [Bradyrhizobium sp. Ai1a-2]
MKVLIASTPATGHLNPLLAVARGLIDEGHEVTFLTGSVLRSRVEAIGAGFRTLPAGADIDVRNIDELIPELKTLEPGLQWLRVAIGGFFVDTLPAQFAGVEQALRDFEPDVVVGDDMFFGVLPMLLGPRANRPAVVLCGTSILHCPRDDGAPIFLGLPPATTRADRDKYAVIAEEFDNVVNAPLTRRTNEFLAEMGCPPLSAALYESVVALADAYLQLSVPSFEFPRKLPPTVHFVGRPPIIANQAPVPPWAADLDGKRKVVLVTQGTVANGDFSLLVAPTLAALADEPDLLVVVTTGGRPVDAIPGPIPSNARVSTYLPFEWILKKTDVFVTNGGYGSVNQAMSFGIPIVSAGLTEDKADVNARIAWSGVGINLATNQPDPQVLREAVRTVLEKPGYRTRAASMADEFAKRDTPSLIVRIINEAVTGKKAPARRKAAAA